jgi:hypothetical protein
LNFNPISNCVCLYNLPANRFYKFITQHAVLILSTLVSLIVGIIYLSIAATRLTNANFGGDAGDYLAAILTRGIPHPTGYPTYILLGILFQYIPFNTPVFRGVLESLIPAALAAGLLTGWVGFVTGSKSAPYLAAGVVTGIAWGVTPLLFSQAVIVEVHGLQALIVVLVLWWITLNLQNDDVSYKKWVLGLSFLLGLGCGNHITLALFAPVALIVLIYSIRHSGSWKFALAQLSLALAGLLVYIYLPLHARTYPPINWGNPQTWQSFLWEVTGNPYHGLLFSAGTPILWDRIRSISNLILDQFGPLGLIAGAIGAIHYSFQIKWLRWILVWIIVAYFVFAIGYNTLDSVGYLVPAVMVFAIWIGLSLPALWHINWKHIPIGLLLIALLILSIALRIPGTRHRLDPRSHDEPARYAEQFLQEAPVNAIVETTTDGDTFPLWYYHFGLHERPDLRIVVLPLTQFVWYQETLVHTYPDLEFPTLYEKDLPNADWGKQIKDLNPEHPVCNTRLSNDTETGIAYECTSP